MSDKPKTLAEVFAEHGIRVEDTPKGKRIPKPKEKK